MGPKFGTKKHPLISILRSNNQLHGPLFRRLCLRHRGTGWSGNAEPLSAGLHGVGLTALAYAGHQLYVNRHFVERGIPHWRGSFPSGASRRSGPLIGWRGFACGPVCFWRAGAWPPPSPCTVSLRRVEFNFVRGHWRDWLLPATLAPGACCSD